MTPSRQPAARHAYYLAHREDILAKVKARALAKKEEIRAYKQRYQQEWKAELAEDKRAYYLANRAAIRAWWKARYAANPQPAKAAAKQYRQANPEKAKAAVLAWMAKNRLKYRAMKRAYAKAHPEHGLASSARRRAREVGAKSGRIHYAAIRAAANGLCGICKEPIGSQRYHYDHIVPLARGGTHTQDNLQLAHIACNLRKGAAL